MEKIVSKKTLTLSADTAGTELLRAHTPRSKLLYEYILQSGGTFGGGTLSFKISLDGGTTKNPLTDATGTAYSTTTADTFTGTIPANTNVGDEPIIYAVLTGSTSPSLTITVIDNR